MAAVEQHGMWLMMWINTCKQLQNNEDDELLFFPATSCIIQHELHGLKTTKDEQVYYFFIY